MYDAISQMYTEDPAHRITYGHYQQMIMMIYLLTHPVLEGYLEADCILPFKGGT